MTNLCPQLSAIDIQGNLMPKMEIPEGIEPMRQSGQPTFEVSYSDTDEKYERQFYDALMAETLRSITRRS